jgi:hypothetical protein
LSPDARSRGDWLRLLESRFQVVRAVPVARAALGLIAMLRCWRGERAHCRVALPAAICHEVVVAVLEAGCEPLFCDVDPADGLVTETEWVKARQRGADVALLVHLYGNPAKARGVRALFAAPGCLLIDDAAQALGSCSDMGPAGGLGDVGLLSFGATKHISCGNAALLFRSEAFAERVAAELSRLTPEPETARRQAVTAFRARFDQARAGLRQQGAGAAGGLAGLLRGLEVTLYEPMTPGVDAALLDSLTNYPQLASQRVMKAHRWSECLAGTGLVAVGMGEGCVPWRYVCRLPGTSWAQQHTLAEGMRASGMHVSNWYLPAHWFLPGTAALPGVETLAREVFQFWVDESATCAAIVENAEVVRRQLSQLSAA